jgi:hypothetical protein
VRRTAGAVLVGAALAMLVAFAATGFGAGATGPAKVRRSGAIAVHAHFAQATGKAAHDRPRTLYGSARTTLPPANDSVRIGRCPKGTHIVNGTLAALHPEQAPNLIIRGFGLLTPRTWFVDVGNVSGDPGFPIKAAAFIVCARG